MAPLRDIVMLLALEDFIIEDTWIDTKANYLADLLSRGKHAEIADMYPQLHVPSSHGILVGKHFNINTFPEATLHAAFCLAFVAFLSQCDRGDPNFSHWFVTRSQTNSTMGRWSCTFLATAMGNHGPLP